jgi:LysR family transcriptional regulator, transcriptional activator of the cysJI operon
MTLRHFKIFLAVSELESMTAAAERLNMTQPPVSQCIAELEAYYGVALFDRIGRGIRITPVGMELRTYAANILQLAEEAERRLLDAHTGGPLRIGASMTVSSTILPPLLRRYASLYPSTRIDIVVDNTATIVDQLLKTTLDLGIVEGRCDGPAMLRSAICDDELVLVCPPGHEWADSGRIGAERLRGRRFFVREQGSGTREVFEAAMLSRGLSWESAGTVNNPDTIIRLVSAGLGLSFVSRRVVEGAAFSGMVSVIEVEDLRIVRRFNLVRHRDKRVTPAMAKLMELVSPAQDAASR